MIHIIFLEPQTSGNVGAIARAMKNFNLHNLVIINPQCNIKDQDARNRAKHAQEVLDNIKVFNSLLEMKTKLELDYLVGSTGTLGRDYNIPRLPITPEDFAKKYAELCESNIDELNIGIIIGREGDGLNNEEILECDFVLTIPTSKEYSSLNASHAASIIFYELFKHSNPDSIISHIKMANGVDKEVLLKEVYRVIEDLDFQTESKRETQVKLWKKLIGKSFLTKREAQALIGFIKKL